MDSWRNPVYVEPFFDEDFGYCFCCLIRSAHGETKFSKRIGDDKNVFPSCFRQVDFSKI